MRIIPNCDSAAFGSSNDDHDENDGGNDVDDDGGGGDVDDDGDGEDGGDHDLNIMSMWGRASWDGSCIYGRKTF